MILYYKHKRLSKLLGRSWTTTAECKRVVDALEATPPELFEDKQAVAWMTQTIKDTKYL